MELQNILKDEKIQKGLKQNLFTIDEDTKYINYNIKNKQKYIVTKPEEFVRAKTLVEIVIEYKYDLEYIDFEVRTSIGAKPDIPADIIIFSDKEHKAPYIVYELKKEDISPKEFEQAVNQGFSYAITQNAKYVVVSNGTKQAYYEVLADKPRERENNVLSHIPINFDESSKNKPKFIKGEFDPQPKTEAELIQKFKTCHDTLWAGGKRAPTEAFDELDKLIFCKFFDEKAPRKKGEAYDFQIYGTTEQIEKRIRALYEEGRQKDPQVFREGIKLNNYEIIEIVKILQDINLNKTDLDAKGKAFETFMDGFFRGAFGQFFTPREVVKMIVNVLPINNNSKVLDTSCGSGGFLLYALDKVRKQADEYYEDGTAEHYRFWHDFAEKQLFGIEINEQISRTAKMNMIIHDDGHTNVITYDGLKPLKHIPDDTGNQHFKEDSFDFILTNPPFGSTIRSTELEEFDKFELSKKKANFFDEKFKNTKITIKANEKSEILFIERAYQYLKENSILAIVLPDGILSNSNLDYVREFIEEHFKYIAIISLPQHTFSVSDAGVKSSVLFLQKYPKSQTDKIKALKEQLKEKAYNLQKANIEKAKKQKDTESINKYKEIVIDEYKKLLKEEIKKLYDYDIFMANTETIGYDSTGKKIESNDITETTNQLNNWFNNQSVALSDIIFIRQWSDILLRIDANYYVEKYIQFEQKILNTIKTGKYRLYKLKDLLLTLKTGTTPKTSDEPYTNESNNIPFLRNTNLTSRGISLENMKYIKNEFKQGLTFSDRNELIICIAGTVGLTTINDYGEIAINQNVSSLLLKEDIVNPYFLSYLLNTKMYQEIINRNASIATIKYLNNENLKNILVPIPNMKIQLEILEDYNIKMEKVAEIEKKAIMLKMQAVEDFEINIFGE